MLIEQSFLSGSNILLKNCNQLDSLLYPLAQWKGTSQKGNEKDGTIPSLLSSSLLIFFFVKDTNLIIYCGRRLYCNPSFGFYIKSEYDSLEKVPSSLSLLTTPINCQHSVETLLDDLRQIVFQRLEPKLYQRKLAFLRLILLCQQRIQLIDSFLKLNSNKSVFPKLFFFLRSILRYF